MPVSWETKAGVCGPDSCLTAPRCLASEQTAVLLFLSLIFPPLAGVLKALPILFFSFVQFPDPIISDGDNDAGVKLSCPHWNPKLFWVHQTEPSAHWTEFRCCPLSRHHPHLGQHWALLVGLFMNHTWVRTPGVHVGTLFKYCVIRQCEACGEGTESLSWGSRSHQIVGTGCLLILVHRAAPCGGAGPRGIKSRCSINVCWTQGDENQHDVYGDKVGDESDVNNSSNQCLWNKKPSTRQLADSGSGEEVLFLIRYVRPGEMGRSQGPASDGHVWTHALGDEWPTVCLVLEVAVGRKGSIPSSHPHHSLVGRE